MKCISIPFNEEKLSALKMFMEQKGRNVTDDIAEYADSLYIKYVPANVREYIGNRENNKLKRTSKSVNSTDEDQSRKGLEK